MCANNMYWSIAHISGLCLSTHGIRLFSDWCVCLPGCQLVLRVPPGPIKVKSISYVRVVKHGIGSIYTCIVEPYPFLPTKPIFMSINKQCQVEVCLHVVINKTNICETCFHSFVMYLCWQFIVVLRCIHCYWWWYIQQLTTRVK